MNKLNNFNDRQNIHDESSEDGNGCFPLIFIFLIIALAGIVLVMVKC